MTKLPTIKQIEKGIKIPVAEWEGRCHEIASAIVDAKLVEGAAVYGFYMGYVHEDSIFAAKPFSRHGWIKQGDRIIDPTRWAFECVKPYLFVGEVLKCSEYDEGMNSVRRALLRPAPHHSQKLGVKAPQFLLVTKTCDRYITSLLGSENRLKNGKLTFAQLGWLANLPYENWGPFANEICNGLLKLGLSALIPIDNRERAQRESK